MAASPDRTPELSPDDPLHRLLVEDRTWIVSVGVVKGARHRDLGAGSHHLVVDPDVELLFREKQ